MSYNDKVLMIEDLRSQRENHYIKEETQVAGKVVLNYDRIRNNSTQVQSCH